MAFLLGFLTIGISSITRPSGQNYLLKTVKRLVEGLSEEEKKEVFMVILLADFDEAHKHTALMEPSDGFNKYVDQGLFHVIYAPLEYYPPLSNLKTKFGDSQQRTYWRSKQVVDFGFLMCYCKDLSQYYLHLEDDLIPSPSFYPKLKDFISQKNHLPILDVAFSGYTAKVFHSSDLESIATYFYLLYNENPVDWLRHHWRQVKEDDNFVLPPASLFQHVGDNSSFIENDDSYKSKEEFFDEFDHKYKGLNPSAIVSSSMQYSYDETKPEHAYNKGNGYFWAMFVKRDDFITIKFTAATTVREVFVDTGSYVATQDLLKSGVLQASFLNNSNKMETNDPTNCKDFETVGDFKDGRVKVSLDGSRKLFCLRILVTKDQDEWLFVREIDVWQA